ncbi:MAG TPA: carbohydrate ABC transporter permease, partial [Clostridia bacterium]|nr:carbohydrate ABC transporter permease [Clostridia bacterium]
MARQPGRSRLERITAFEVVNYVVLSLIACTTLFPFWDVLATSFMDLKQYLSIQVHIFPRYFVLDNYRHIFSMGELWSSYRNTIFVVVVGTTVNMLVTITAGFVLSRPALKGQRVFMFLITFTMLFSGGIIPTYMVVRQLGLMNKLWALIVPSAVSTYNLILMRNYFLGIPKELEEAATVDGAGELTTLIRIFLPVSLPSIATIALFYAVGHWNQYFQAVLYISRRASYTLQLFLRTMLSETEAAHHRSGHCADPDGVPLPPALLHPGRHARRGKRLIESKVLTRKKFRRKISNRRSGKGGILMKHLSRILCLTLVLVLMTGAGLAATPLTFLKSGDTAGKPLVE